MLMLPGSMKTLIRMAVWGKGNRRILILGSCWLLSVFCSASAAEVDLSVDAVTLKDKQVYSIRGDQLELATNVVKLPFDVEVNTNGMFKVAGGTERELIEGQVIRKDGWLMDPNGFIQPVFDHVVMRAGSVLVVRDGKAQPLTQTLTFANNLTLAPDGSVVYPSGNRSRLADGQLFRLDGTPIPSKDSITLKNGRIVVLRGGTLIPLAPAQIMGMNDGTRVQGDGQITKPDGTVFQLNEGQTMLVDGAAPRG